MAVDKLLDLDRGHPVTAEDIEAQRRLRASVPSWLGVDWRVLEQFIRPDARDKRPIANDRWEPFELD